MRATIAPVLVALVAAATVVMSFDSSRTVLPQIPDPGGPAAMQFPPLRHHARRFVENQGQWPGKVRFGLRQVDTMTWFDDDGWTHVRGHGARAIALRMRFEEGRSAAPLAEEQLSGTHSWFLGQDPDRWVRGARGFARLRYASVFDGVDLVVRKPNDPQACFEYDLVLRPGADLERVRLSCRGQESLRLGEDGSLLIETAIGTLRQPPPVTWSVGSEGERQALVCRYRILEGGRFGFEVPQWDGLSRLVIDPGIIWSTYLGGSGMDGVLAMETDKLGRITVTGTTSSSDFPTTLGAFDRKFKAAAYRTNIFVSQFSADGKKLIFSTYLGGTTGVIAWALDVHSSGIVTIVGQTFSSDFPTTAGVFQPKFGGGSDAFITKLDPTGSKLIWSTYFGGSGTKSFEECRAVDVDAKGDVVVAGDARGALPTTQGAFQTKQGSTFSVNPFVAHFGSAGKKLVFSTWCGGTNFGIAKTVALDAKGRITIAGHSGSKDYPVTKGAYQTKPGSSGFNYDAFVTQLDPTGSKLVWSTWIGGAQQETIEDLKLAANGDVVFTGWTKSNGYPTTIGTFQSFLGGSTSFRDDAFVTRLAATGAKLVWSTFLGGNAGDEARGIFLDAAENVTIVGMTGSKNFPVTKGAMSTKIKGAVFNWQAEGFVSRLSHDATSLIYSTYLGGSNTETPVAISVLRDGDAIVGGGTLSSDFPVSTGSFQTKLKGQSDGFVTKLDLLPAGIARIGRSTDCQGPVLLYPSAQFTAATGSGGLLVGNAPKKAAGLLALGGASSVKGFVIGGASIHLDLSKWIVVLPIGSDAQGRANLPLSFGQLPKGFRFAAQTVWLNNQACSHKSLFSASAALDITLQ